MKTYTITVKAVYMQEMEVLAEDSVAAESIAIKEFEPDPDCLFSIDVYGLDPWQPTDGREDYEYEISRQKEIDDEA